MIAVRAYQFIVHFRRKRSGQSYVRFLMTSSYQNGDHRLAIDLPVCMDVYAAIVSFNSELVAPTVNGSDNLIAI